ncbi:MAG: hypothetical protein R3C53_23380 [Pirellulaceae bacterium]
MNPRSGRQFRFRLQTLLVLVTTFLVALGLVTRGLHREHRKKQDMVVVEPLRNGCGSRRVRQDAFSPPAVFGGDVRE